MPGASDILARFARCLVDNGNGTFSMRTSVAGVTPVADGTYVTGAKLTGGGVNGSITVSKGIITAVTEAT